VIDPSARLRQATGLAIWAGYRRLLSTRTVLSNQLRIDA
jgi:hypothetical protein